MAFDESKVPEGPAADLLYDGKTGEGITDEQYDTMKARMLAHGPELPWAPPAPSDTE